MTEPRWVTFARTLLGTKEFPGAANNPVIVAMHKATTGKNLDDSVPWCASFVSYCLEKVSLESSNNPMARSYSRWGVPVKGEPPVGAIVVLSSTRGPTSGHVGFCVGVDSASVHLLGGNQGDKVSIATFPKGKIVAVRWPEGEPIGEVRKGGVAELEPSDA